MTRRRGTLVALAGVLAAVAAVAAVVPAAATAAHAATAPAPSTTKVVLISPGKGPRSPLRLSFTSGTATSGSMSMQQTVEQSIDGKEQKIGAPTTDIHLHVTTGAVAADGAAEVTSVYDSIDVGDDGTFSAAQKDAYGQAIQGMVGVTTNATVSPRNENSQTSITGTDSLPETLQQSMSQFSDQMGALSAPFPVEAVGIGAKWRVDTAAEVNGIELHQRTVYTLQARDADHAVLLVTGTQSAPHQTVSLPGVPAGAKTTILKFSSTVSGRSDVDLHTALLARAGTMNIRSYQVFGITYQGQSAEIEQRLTMKMDVAADVPG